MQLFKNEKIKYILVAIAGFGLFFGGSLLFMYGLYAVHNIKYPTLFTDFYTNLINYDNPLAVGMLQFVSYIPFLVIILFLLKDEIKNDFVDFKRNYKKYLLYAVIGFGLLMFATVVVNMVYYALGDLGTSENEEAITKILLSDGALPMIISVVIMAPVAEELLFRKIFFGVFEKSFNLKPLVAILASAFIFAFIHVSDPASMKYIFQYLPLALIMCSVYHYSNNNIFVAILIHLMNNSFAVVATYFAEFMGV